MHYHQDLDETVKIGSVQALDEAMHFDFAIKLVTQSTFSLPA